MTCVSAEGVEATKQGSGLLPCFTLYTVSSVLHRRFRSRKDCKHCWHLERKGVAGIVIKWTPLSTDVFWTSAETH